MASPAPRAGPSRDSRSSIGAQSFGALPFRGTIRRLTSGVRKVIERGDRVGLGPDAHFPGVLELVVVPLDGLLAVEGDSEVSALKVDSQRVPLVRGDLHVRPLPFS